MAKNTTASAPKTSYTSKSGFNTVAAITRLMESMEIAIHNMIDEVRKPVDQEINGSARKAELQSVKQTAVDCQDLIKKYEELAEMKRNLETSGSIEELKDFSAGYAEKFSKK
jgi:hypothetical protein